MNKESQNIEWKESWRDEYLKWICGFANAQGGKIFIGIDDKGGVTGVEDYKKLLEDIPNKTINHLGLVVDVNLRTKTKKQYLEISVAPSDVAIAYHGTYYYRSGSTKQELKGAALQQFILKKFGRSWDNMIVDNASLKDIDSNAVKRFVQKSIEIQRLPLSANKDNTETLLTRLHLLTDKKKLKAAALLLFGKDPLKYFTQAYFKIGRFGKSDADLKFQDVVEGNILDMADKVIELLRSKYLTSPIRYEGLRRMEELEYPEPALREAVLNAVVHKNYAGTTIQLSVYDDKLILWNQGTLPDEISIEQIKEKHASHPRNRNIAEIFFKAGYIESWGRGITKILEACSAAGLPEPDIKETQGGIQITFLKDIYTNEYLTNLGLEEHFVATLLFIKTNGSITNSQYQQIFNVSKRKSTNDLQYLTNENFIEKIGTRGRGTFYRLKLRR